MGENARDVSSDGGETSDSESSSSHRSSDAARVESDDASEGARATSQDASSLTWRPSRSAPALTDARRTRVLQMVERMKAFDAAARGTVDSEPFAPPAIHAPLLTSSAALASTADARHVRELVSASVSTGISATLRSATDSGADLQPQSIGDATESSSFSYEPGHLERVWDALRGGGSAFPSAFKCDGDWRGARVPLHIQDLVATALSAQALGWLAGSTGVVGAVSWESRASEYWAAWTQASVLAARGSATASSGPEVVVGDAEDAALVLLHMQLESQGTAPGFVAASPATSRSASALFSVQEMLGLAREPLRRANALSTALRWCVQHGIPVSRGALAVQVGDDGEPSAAASETNSSRRRLRRTASPPPWMRVEAMTAAQRQQASLECLQAIRRAPSTEEFREPQDLPGVAKRGFVQWSSGLLRSSDRRRGGEGIEPSPILRSCDEVLRFAARGLNASGRPWASGLAALPALRALRFLCTSGVGVLPIAGHLGSLVLVLSERIASASDVQSSWMLLHVLVG